MSAIYTGDANADISGGAATGTAYLHRIGLIGDIDVQSAFGWRGARAHVSVHSIIGTGPSAYRVGNVLTVSGIDAEPALRLFNLWIDQKPGDRMTLRVGQFNADQSFAISATASLFVKSSFGWPGSFAADLSSGGPAYPLAAPGASLSVTVAKHTAMRLAAFVGDPAGPGDGDPQRRDLHGFARVAASPGNRNVIDLYGDAGLTLTGALRSRPDDIVGVGIAVARLSPDLRALHLDSCAIAGVSCHAPAAEDRDHPVGGHGRDCGHAMYSSAKRASTSAIFIAR
ncbi:carbohydrate porin [Sphingomonas sp. RB3P16]|uniref:carbohydrate porin n=1 Tax=Parasphingomonas frigoris TaxID=3096163 RepID=UPI002FC79720